ncbi:MAG: antitoxin [Nanoarchaeota archaeon]
MVQAMISIQENTNRVLNIIKAKYGLKDKSQAIDLVVSEYEKNIMEPELKPEYKAKLTKMIKGKYLSRAEFEKVINDV